MFKLSSGDGVLSSPVLLSMLFTSYATVSVGCCCLSLSVGLFSFLPLLSFLFVPSSSRQLFQSGRYCIKSASSPSHVLYFLIPPMKILSQYEIENSCTFFQDEDENAQACIATYSDILLLPDSHFTSKVSLFMQSHAENKCSISVLKCFIQR